MINQYESLARIICHTCLHRLDDVHLKNKTGVKRMCPFCNSCGQEDAQHLVLKCPLYQTERESMFKGSRLITDETGVLFLNDTSDILILMFT